MPEVIAFIVVGSLVLGAVAVMCLQFLITRRGRQRLRTRTVVASFLLTCSFVITLGLGVVYVLDHSTYPWAAGAAVMMSAPGLAIFVMLQFPRGQRIGLLAIAVASFSGGVQSYGLSRGSYSDVLLLLPIATVVIMLTGLLHLAAIVETKRRLAGIPIELPVSLDTRLMRLSRRLLAIACCAMLIVDGAYLISAESMWLIVATICVAALLSGTAFVLAYKQFSRWTVEYLRYNGRNARQAITRGEGEQTPP